MTQSKTAVIVSDTKPTPEQIDRFKAFLTSKYGEIRLAFREDKSISKGFILEVGNDIYDWSDKGRMAQLEKAIESVDAQPNFIPLLYRAIDNWKPSIKPDEFGRVLKIGDGIATVDGLLDAAYGEILVFENGSRGMVQNLAENEIGCILFDNGENVMQGSKVHKTGKTAGIPVGDSFIGRIISPLGVAVDGKGEIPADDYLPVEAHAPGIIDRQPVTTPLETGILAIDSMFPIGRGQRELIIGDRQTGKTAIAVDTILNQKGKDVICIYVAIGQKASGVAALANTLQKAGAMDYTIIINSSASDPASTQYIAPYAGCAMGEYFMHKGKDVLIIYDDLSKHAVAYRALSLLLGRAPGREAYPGDIFYLHSRLLERSAHLSDEKGGGSLTALPIVETQAGDVSAYIPTNVISITDGQIFLETDLFFNGQRPAINIGLSVSRVGGDAQTKVMKKSSGTLRLDIAQYREMEVFTRFSSDRDEATSNMLKYGKSLLEILKQKQHHPIIRHRQVIMLLVATARKLTDVDNIPAYLENLFKKIEKEYPAICDEIDKRGTLSDENKKIILEIM